LSPYGSWEGRRSLLTEAVKALVEPWHLGSKRDATVEEPGRNRWQLIANPGILQSETADTE